MTNGQNIARARHLEEVAKGAKRYILAEILDVANAVATELEDRALDDFAGATSIAGGLSGLVPAPQIGDNNKFLRGNGTWSTLPSSVDYVIGSKVSTVEGGLWRDVIDAAPVLKLRHGDYEYNFNYDGLTYLGGENSPVATVTPDTYVLGTDSVSSEGGLWYEVTNDVPTLNLHAGNFNYSFNYDTITYKGDKTHLVSYLPFDASTTADACGNVWTVPNDADDPEGVTLDTEIKKFGEASLYLKGYTMTATMPFSLNAEKWTVELWAQTDSTDSFAICLLGGNLRLAGSNFSASAPNFRQGYAAAPVKNQWYHFALVKNGNELIVFRDGVEMASVTLNNTLNDNNVLCLGAQGHRIHIDSFRIFDGVALWTENFTPPTAADYL